MRHQKARKQLGRTSAHRTALFNNLLTALVEHGRIKTTERKARELRRVAERTISRATRLGETLLKEPGDLSVEESARYVHAIRLVRRRLKDRKTTQKLFEEWAPRYLERPGGYTRMLKLGFRRGDAAPMALVEFLTDELPQQIAGEAEQEKGAKKAKKSSSSAGAKQPA